MTMTAMWTWIEAHPFTVSLVLYLVLNIAKRVPPPPQGTWKYRVWSVFESMMVLPWDQWFGALKTIPKGTGPSRGA